MSAATPAQISLDFIPTFAFVRPLAPKNGLLWSALVHVFFIALVSFSWTPQDTSTRLRDQTVIELPAHTPLAFVRLPGMSSSGDIGSAQPAAKSSRAGHHDSNDADSRTAGAVPLIKALYAGPVEIVSKLPDATNLVQTIRRPDLVKPPKLKFPIRVQSMVMLPAPPAPVLAARPEPPKPAETGVESKAVPAVEEPALPVPVAAAEQPPSNTSETANKSATSTQTAATAGSAQAPAAASIPDAQETTAKAAVVLNAVAVPPDTLALVPNAEISGNFSVAPASTSAAAPADGARSASTGSGTGNGKDGGTGTSAAAGGNEGLGRNAGKASAPGGGSAGNGAAGPTSGGSGNSGSGRQGSGPGRGGAGGEGPGNGGIPGITIAGGNVGGRSPSAPSTRPGYGITIISGGRSGGAVRDLGTFGRNEVVYTVYIPMSDAGGGPDWPMQYSLVDPVAAGNGLVAPPVAIKKVAAEVSSKTPISSGSRIFLSGVISTSGELRDLRPVRPQENSSQTAVEALQQWRFAPAEVNGRAVETKVLIGVSIINSAPTNSAAGSIAPAPLKNKN